MGQQNEPYCMVLNLCQGYFLAISIYVSNLYAQSWPSGWIIFYNFCRVREESGQLGI